jgi:Tol biopolymer transport system component
MAIEDQVMNIFSFSLEKAVIRGIRTLLTLIISLLMMVIGGGCKPNSESNSVDIHLLSPLGKPPANTLLWSPIDQNKLLVSSGYANFTGGVIYILNNDTGEKQVLVQANQGSLDIRNWSPEGNSIIFSVDTGTTGFDQGGLWEMGVDDAAPSFLQGESNRMIWGPDNNVLTIEKSETNESGQEITELVWVDRTTHKETMIFESEVGQTILGFSWSPDGRQLVFSMGDAGLKNDFSLYVLDVQSGRVKQIPAEGDNTDPVWSPTNDLITYLKKTLDENQEVFSLYLIDPNGDCDVKLHSSDFLLSPTWSPDGSSIAFIEPNANGIFVADINHLLTSDYENLCQ